jgi:hypothetical protein
LKLGWQRVGGDPQVVEERSANEPFDADGLRLATETPDETLVVVGPAADAISVGVVRVLVGEDGVFIELGDQPNAKERDRVAM